MKQIHPAFSS